MILSESFEETIGLNSIESWLELKYQDIHNQIISAQKSRIQNKWKKEENIYIHYDKFIFSI